MDGRARGVQTSCSAKNKEFIVALTVSMSMCAASRTRRSSLTCSFFLCAPSVRRGHAPPGKAYLQQGPLRGLENITDALASGVVQRRRAGRSLADAPLFETAAVPGRLTSGSDRPPRDLPPSLPRCHSHAGLLPPPPAGHSLGRAATPAAATAAPPHHDRAAAAAAPPRHDRAVGCRGTGSQRCRHSAQNTGQKTEREKRIKDYHQRPKL